MPNSFIFHCYDVWFSSFGFFHNHRHGNGASIFTASGLVAKKFQIEVEAVLVRFFFFFFGYFDANFLI